MLRSETCTSALLQQQLRALLINASQPGTAKISRVWRLFSPSILQGITTLSLIQIPIPICVSSMCCMRSPRVANSCPHPRNWQSFTRKTAMDPLTGALSSTSSRVKPQFSVPKFQFTNIFLRLLCTFIILFGAYSNHFVEILSQIVML